MKLIITEDWQLQKMKYTLGWNKTQRLSTELQIAKEVNTWATLFPRRGMWLHVS